MLPESGILLIGYTYWLNKGNGDAITLSTFWASHMYEASGVMLFNLYKNSVKYPRLIDWQTNTVKAKFLNILPQWRRGWTPGLPESKVLAHALSCCASHHHLRLQRTTSHPYRVSDLPSLIPYYFISFILLFVCAQSLSCVWLFVALWTIAHQAPLSTGFSRQETGAGCHLLPQGIFPTQGLNLCLLWLFHCRWILYSWGEPLNYCYMVLNYFHVCHPV